MILFLYASGDSIAAPDVHTLNLREYTLCNLDDPKLLCFMYASALENQLDSLYLLIYPMLENVPEIQQDFHEAHLAFMGYAEEWAAFEESSQWFDLNSGESYYGSGMGYQKQYVLCTLYWQQILLYRKFISSVSEDGFSCYLMDTLPDSLLGGY